MDVPFLVNLQRPPRGHGGTSHVAGVWPLIASATPVRSSHDTAPIMINRDGPAGGASDRLQSILRART